jgi:hypothetical protein
MFKEGNLIRLITEDGDADIVHVVKDQENTTVLIDLGPDDNSDIRMEDAGDYELVSDGVKKQEVTPIVPFTPNRTIEAIHDDVQRMMVQLAQYYQAAEVSGTLHMKLEATVYGNDSELTLNCCANLGYGTEVITRDLNKSVKIAVDRARENDALKPIEITFEGKAVA